MTSSEKKQLQMTACKVRMGVIDSTHGAKAGHPGGSLSAAEVFTYLYFKEMNIDPKNPKWADRDRFVLSKGHTAPGLYSVLAERGFFPVEDLPTLRHIDSYLQGHPNMNTVPGVDMSTGSLGQGVSAAVGMALAAKYQGKTLTVDAAVLYANDGTGLVEWIPSKRGVKMDLLRSNDGGKSWIKVLDNVDQSKYVNNYKKGSYKDAKTANSQYKIVVRDAKGNAAESTPNNVAGVEAKYIKEMTTKVPAQIGISHVKGTWKLGDRRLMSFGVLNNRPVTASANLIQNGSFEENKGQWTSVIGGMASVVTDKTAPSGGKSLYFNSTGAKSGNFNTKFTVKVQKNTDYVFSTWVKGAYLGADNKGHSSIGVINPDTGKFLVHTAIKTDANGNVVYKKAKNKSNGATHQKAQPRLMFGLMISYNTINGTDSVADTDFFSLCIGPRVV